MNLLSYRAMNAGRSLVLAVVVAATVIGAGAGAAHESRVGQLHGRWTLASAERDGKPADDLRGHTLTFARDAFVIHAASGSVLYRGTYRTDADRKPAHIDLRHTEGELRGKTWLGVYALDGDRLSIADNAPDLTKPRPPALATKPDSGYVLLTFRRA